jgi:hypothetical protein
MPTLFRGLVASEQIIRHKTYSLVPYHTAWDCIARSSAIETSEDIPEEDAISFDAKELRYYGDHLIHNRDIFFTEVRTVKISKIILIF